jgi:hypothetical protein
VSARLRGEYQVTRDDRIDLEFKNITLSIGPFKAAEKVCDSFNVPPVAEAQAEISRQPRTDFRLMHCCEQQQPWSCAGA